MASVLSWKKRKKLFYIIIIPVSQNLLRQINEASSNDVVHGKISVENFEDVPLKRDDFLLVYPLQVLFLFFWEKSCSFSQDQDHL